jgi:hypothetical protein
MKVKVIKASSSDYWYADKIGEIFEVFPTLHHCGGGFSLKSSREGPRIIKPEDCEIMKLTLEDKIEKAKAKLERFEKKKLKEARVKGELAEVDWGHMARLGVQVEVSDFEDFRELQTDVLQEVIEISSYPFRVRRGSYWRYVRPFRGLKNTFLAHDGTSEGVPTEGYCLILTKRGIWFRLLSSTIVWDWLSAGHDSQVVAYIQLDNGA